MGLAAVSQMRQPHRGGRAAPARSRTDEKRAWLACSLSPLVFIHEYAHLYDAQAGDWIPFHLWPAQAPVLKAMQAHRLVVVLKARQIGMTWLALGFALWLMLFHPAATILLFSRRDDEAVDLLDFRLKGMYGRLPRWMQARAVAGDSKHEFTLSNGSRALAFPTTAGDSYTATLAIADEFDLVQDQGRLMRSVKPTVDNGGRMILLSRPDKSRPRTRFKAIYRAAKAGQNDWQPVFLPWHAHPGRDRVWYEAQRADILSATGSEDDLHEQYPETDTQALAPRTLDKRIPATWLQGCYEEQPPRPLPDDAPSYDELKVYVPPQYNHHYVIGADPAEGNPTSDDSALVVLDRESGEEVAVLSGKLQPSALAERIDRVGVYYNRADVMVERNNHGHAVLLWLREHSKLRRLPGHDGKEGWLSSAHGKTLLYDGAADAFRFGEVILHSFKAYTQLASIEGSTLRAPAGELDDHADSCALALAARNTRPVQTLMVQARVKGRP